MECEFPQSNATNDELVEMMDEMKTIAVMGLSPVESKPSFFVPKYMQEQGYKIFPVYPKEDTIMGEKVYRSLSEIPENVDCVNIFRKPAAVTAIVDEAIKRGDVKIIWMQEGIVNNEAADKAREAGMKVVQTKCLMVEHRMIKG
jgi:uncharacterized protein